MRTLPGIILLATLPLLALPAQAEQDNLNFGAGIGFTYSGLGGYAAYTQDQQIFAFSAGAVNIGNSETTFGAGVSWLRTDWFGDSTNRRHAAGIYLGAVGSENRRNSSGDGFSRSTVWGGGPVYQYYQNGSNRAGLVGGAGVLFGDAQYETDTSIVFSIGYQF